MFNVDRVIEGDQINVLCRNHNKLIVFWLVKINGTNCGIAGVSFFDLQITPWDVCGSFFRIIKQASWIINVCKVEEGEQINILCCSHDKLVVFWLFYIE